jgi:hypothetical protein
VPYVLLFKNGCKAQVYDFVRNARQKYKFISQKCKRKRFSIDFLGEKALCVSTLKSEVYLQLALLGQPILRKKEGYP